MKKSLLTLFISLSALWVAAQVDTVTIYQLQYVDQATLQSCIDTNHYNGNTVHFIGVVSVDGSLSEMASQSISGKHRPFINVVDTNGGVGGPFKGVDLMGVINGTSTSYPGFENLVAGDVISVTGLVGGFDGETQVEPISSSSITVLGNINAPQPIIVPLSDLNDDQRVNKLETGEQWEGNYIELQNLTITAVNYFAGGSRVSFDAADANGNLINVGDRFLAQRLPSWQSVNPQSPQTTGSFVVPPVGTQYSHIRGMVIHSNNGCTGGTGRGYDINPTIATDYEIGVAPPNITNITRSIVVPKSTESVTISATITDFDGSITSAVLKYSTNPTDPLSAFTSINLNNTSGDIYEATIPANADGTVVRYILEATDDASNTTTFPFTPASQTNPNAYSYVVRDNGLQIVDLQRTYSTSDLSPFSGQVVTVSGVVTASTKSHDLGYVFIQQPNEEEFSGINLIGSLDLVALCRDEKVTVTGTVEESFGHTRINVTNVVRHNQYEAVEPVVINPSDANLNNEAYESVLVQAVNPSNGKLYITNANNGFGEYSIGTSKGATNSTRVLAGRQSSSSFSSLYVSLIADSFYIDNDGQLEVTPVLTDTSMTMDTLVGIVYFGFSTYKIQPRNNDDIKGLNVTLDPSQFVSCIPDSNISVNENLVNAQLNIYPNPSNGQLNISDLGASKVYQINIFDMQGKHVFTRIEANPINTLDINFIPKGMYMVQLQSKEGLTMATRKLIVQ